MEDQADLETMRRRLKKALSVAEKLKNDNEMEHEVNVELAKRNEALKKELSSAEERVYSAKAMSSILEHSLHYLGGVIGKLVLCVLFHFNCL